MAVIRIILPLNRRKNLDILFTIIWTLVAQRSCKQQKTLRVLGLEILAGRRLR